MLFQFDILSKYFKIKFFFNIKNKENRMEICLLNNFLKIKQEASGYPRWVKNNEDKIKYNIDNFKF